MEAINLSFSERDRFQLVAATVKDRMSPAIDLYLKEKLAARKHMPKTNYNTGKADHLATITPFPCFIAIITP